MQSVLVLGGSSEIGLATVRALVAERARTVVLAVRDPAAMTPTLHELHHLGATSVDAIPFDAADADGAVTAVDAAFERFGDFDLVLLAFGVLGDQATYDADPRAAAEAATVNYVGAVATGLAVAQQFRRQGHGTLVVLSSVAAERPRKTNYVYGSTKAGLDAFSQGLGDALVGTGARVMVVRPGFVFTRMTEGMPSQPLSTTPEVVAQAILAGLERGRDVVWAPGPLRWLFAVLRHLPRPLWRIVSAR